MEMGVAMRMLHKPGATEHVTLPGEEIRNVELGFKLADVTAARQGDDLVLSFADGAQLVFSEYFQIHDGNFPELNFADGLRHLGPDDIRTDWERPHDKVEAEPGGREDGSDGAQSGVSADSGADARASAPEQGTPSPAQEAQIQAALQQNDAPRAGPNSLGSVQESNYHAWEELDLLDGRPHLGPLDIGWNRGWNQENPHTSAGRRDDGEDSSILDGNAVVSPAPGDQPLPPNALPIIDGADVALEVREAGVRGNDPDLGHLTDSNTAYDGKITATGSADALDPDGDALTWLVRGTGGSGASAETTYGSVSINPDGSYTYTLDASRSNILAQGETKTDSFVLLVSDGRGGTAEETVVVTITGTNDAPVLNFVEGEDGSHRLHYSGETVKGALEVADPDADGKLSDNTSGHVTQQFSITGDSGTTGTSGQGIDGSATFEVSGKGILTVNADGSYSFVSSTAVTGETTLKFNVTTTDAHTSVSNTKTITVTLTPNKPPQITSTEHDHAVTESGVKDGGNEAFAGIPTVTGKITGSDADSDDLTYAIKDGNSAPNGSSTKNGTYGSLTLQPDGQYTYTLTNDENSAADKLAFGVTKTENFTVTVSDGHGGSVEQTINVNVTGTNDKPVLTLTGDGTHKELADGGKTTAEGSFSVDDPDSDGAWAAGTSNANHKYVIDSGTDTIGKATNGELGQSSSFTSEYGTLTVNANGTYSYKVNPSSDKVIALNKSTSHTDEFVVKVLDKHGAWSEQTIRVEITGKDDPPKISLDAVAMDLVEQGVQDDTKDEATTPPGKDHVEGSLSAENVDTDKQDYTLTFGLQEGYYIDNADKTGTAQDVGNGTLALQTDYGLLTLTSMGKDANGKWGCEYAFDLDESDADGAVNKLTDGQQVTLRFTVTVSDGHGGVQTEDLVFTITGRNDAPLIDGTGVLSIENPEYAAWVVTEDGKKNTTGTVTAHDPDGPQAELSYSLVDDQGGKVQMWEGDYGKLFIDQTTGEYTYTLYNDKVQYLSGGQSGEDVFTVRVTDKKNTGSYTEEKIHIPIRGTDDKPEFDAASLRNEVREDSGNDVNSITGDSPDGTSKETDPAIIGNIRAEDVDRDDTQTYHLVGKTPNDAGDYVLHGKYGTLTLHKDGSYDYVLDDNDTNPEIQKLNTDTSLQDSFEVRVDSGLNGQASSSATGNLVINIKGTNDSPVFSVDDSDLEKSVNESGNLTLITTGKIQATDVDDADGKNDPGPSVLQYHFMGTREGEGDILFDVQSFQGKYGIIKIDRATGEYEYTLNAYSKEFQELGAGRRGEEAFEVYVDDAHGGQTKATIMLNVNGITVTPPSGGPGENVSGTDLKTQEDYASVTSQIDDYLVAGTLNYTSPGSQPSDYEFGFKFGATGGGIKVQTLVGKYGSIRIIDAKAGSYEYVLDNSSDLVQNLHVGETVTEDFPLWSSDGSKITVTVVGTNDAPEITSSQDLELTQSLTESVEKKGQAFAEDTDHVTAGTIDNQGSTTDGGTFFTWWLVDADGNPVESVTSKFGTVTINKETGEYTYTYLPSGKHLNQDQAETDHFTVMVKDGSGDAHTGFATTVIEVTIKGTNEDPELTLKPLEVTEDGTVQASATATATDDVHDADGAIVGGSYRITNSDLGDGGSTFKKGHFGTLTIDPQTGEYTYTLDNAHKDVQALGEGRPATDTFYITVFDKHGGKDTQEVTVTITGTNDDPTMTLLDSVLKVQEDGIVIATGRATGSDVDLNADGSKDTLSYHFTAEDSAEVAKYGTFEIDANGKYTFTLNNDLPDVQALHENQVKDFHFTIYAKDEHGGSSSMAEHNVTVHIVGSNDAPEFVDADGKLLGDALLEATLALGDAGLTGKVTANDVDGDTVAYSIKDGGAGAYGTLSIDVDGKYTYTLHDGLTAADLPIDARENFTIEAYDANMKGDRLGGSDSIALNITITGGPAPTTLSLSSLLTDAPEEGDSPLFSSLIAENASLDSLLGGADNTDNVSAPADPAMLPGTEAPHAVAPLSAPVELVAPSGGQEEAVARMMVEQAV